EPGRVSVRGEARERTLERLGPPVSAQPHLGVPSRALHGPAAKPRQHRRFLAIAGTAFLLLVGAGFSSPSLANDSLGVEGAGFLNRSLEEDSLAVASGARDSVAAGSGASDSVFLNRSLEEDSLAARGGASGWIVSFPSPRVRAWQVGLVRGDRMEHASLSFALTSALIIVTRNRAASAATALAFGVGKELWDQRTSRFDPVDLTADAVGVGLATLLVTPQDRKSTR